jgi:hypothetical protein
MSQEDSVEEREHKFGHIVAQTELGEVYSLDLFEARDLVCRGFYIPPPISPWMPEGLIRMQPALLHETELRVARAVMDGLRAELEFDEGPEGFVMYGGEYFEVYGSRYLVTREEGVEMWTGSVVGRGSNLMTYVLRRYGSPEVAIVLLAIFLMIHMDRRADALDKECRRTAIEACGERGVKRFRTRRAWMSLTQIGLDHECEWECQ